VPGVTITDTDIANLALDAVGTRSTIASLQEQSTEATTLARQYPIARAAILRAAHWDFARKQAQMSLLLDATQGQAVPQPWLYEYAPPNDCVRMRYILPTFQSTATPVPGNIPTPIAAQYLSAPVRFVVSSDVDQNGNDVEVVLTNQPTATLVYTKLITNPNLFDSLFIQAFVAYLASLICEPLTGSGAKINRLYQQAQAATQAARAANGNEGLTIDDHTPDWIRVRGYLSDWGWPANSIWMCQPQALSLIA
jgi:hypothetical protein